MIYLTTDEFKGTTWLALFYNVLILELSLKCLHFTLGTEDPQAHCNATNQWIMNCFSFVIAAWSADFHDYWQHWVLIGYCKTFVAAFRQRTGWT